MNNKYFIRYHKTICLLSLGSALIVIASLYFIFITGEAYSVRTIAERQQVTGYFYGSGISDEQTHAYKLSLYYQIRPAVITLGSSRMLQFRGEDFSVPFVNMGLSMRSLEQGHQMADAMLAVHRPQLVILGADFWWFAAGRGVEPHRSMDTGVSVNLSKLLEPYRLFIRGKLSIQLLLDILKKSAPWGGKAYGLNAIGWDDGYDKFGSRHYTSMLDGRREPYTLPENVYPAIESGENYLSFKDKYSPEDMASYRRLIEKFQNAGIEVIVIIPPNLSTANELIARMPNQGLVDNVRKEIMNLSVKAYDFHSVSGGLIHSNDCEFIDVWHGGEVTYLRILKLLADENDRLKRSVKYEQIDDLIKKHHGQAAIRRSNFPIRQEVDFLRIGCPVRKYI